MAYRNYGPASGFVVSQDNSGDFKTIGAALTAAAGKNKTIFIKPGTYAEDPTLKAGVNLTAWGSDSSLNGTGNVIISGKCTFTGAGSVTISGIQLQTNSDFFLAVTGSSASVVNLNNCYLNCLNNTGISFTSSSASSQINAYFCNGNIGTTGISLFSNSSNGNLSIIKCNITNSGGSSTASTISGTGLLTVKDSLLISPLTTSGTSATFLYVNVFTDMGGQNVAAITHNSTAGANGGSIYNSIFGSGTASSISVGAGATLIVDNIVVNSTNANAIAGAGTITLGKVTFTNTSSNISTTTVANDVTTLGNLHLTGISTANQLLYTSAASTVSGLTSGNSLLAATNSAGTLAMRAFSVVTQVFTSTGTYTPTTGMLYCVIECIGGGGGGGGAQTNANALQVSVGGGGGGGGYSRKTFVAGTATLSGATVTIGAAGTAGANTGGTGGTGGTSSVASLISATGGVGGTGGTASNQNQNAGGAGGAGSSGDFNTNGSPGGSGMGLQASGVVQYQFSGAGGSTFFGGGGLGIANLSIATAGNAGSSYGGGGSGATGTNGTGAAGGAGFNGLVVITEYVIN